MSSVFHKLILFFQILVLLPRFLCHTNHGQSTPFNKSLFNRYRGGYQNQDNEYYDILGIKRTATEKEIKRAYRDKAMKVHPDRGGNAEEFKKLAEAYEILSNTEKKNVYDKFGKARLNGQYSHEDGDDVNNPFGADLNSFFRGFGSNFGQSFGRGRGFPGFSMPVVYRLDLSLEDLYKGKKLKIPIQVAASQNSQQQPAQEHIDISIEPGMASGFELIVRGVGSSSYGGGGQDIIFRIHEKDHPIFTRQHADLLMELKITLQEALFGFHRNITHLDQRIIYFQSPQEDEGSGSNVINPDDVFVLENEGMPVYGEYKKRGKLYIKIKLQMPRQFGVPRSTTTATASNIRTNKSKKATTTADDENGNSSVIDHLTTSIASDEDSIIMENKKRKKMLAQFRKLYCSLSGESPLISDTDEEDNEVEVMEVKDLISSNAKAHASTEGDNHTAATTHSGSGTSDTTRVASSSSSESGSDSKKKYWNTTFKHHFLSQKQNQQRTVSQPLSSSTPPPLQSQQPQASPAPSATQISESLDSKTAEQNSNSATAPSQNRKYKSSPSTTTGNPPNTADTSAPVPSQPQPQPSKSSQKPPQPQPPYKTVKRADLKSFGSIGRREAEQEDDYESTFQRFFFR